ncbi:hypothetical protein [Pseudorhodoplanes sp.]|uniref:hypothetical protein n=1 Tax=Pseudorhodoplanes sp. TaxID=1934341 RepID=UPI00391A7D27
MKRNWMIPAMMAAGLIGFGGAAHAASAGYGWREASGSAADAGRTDYSWSAQRWRDEDSRPDVERGPRWRDRDDRGGGPRSGWRRGDDDCGPGMRGRGYGMGYGMGRGHGYHGGHGDDGYRRHGYGRDDDRGYGRPGMGRGYGPRHGRFGEPMGQAALDSAKRELGITAAQEEAWTKYAATLKEVGDARRARRDSVDRDAIRRMSPDEHRQFRDSMIEQRRKEQDQINAAVDALVKSLDEKQVAIAKDVLPGYAFGGMRGAFMGRGHGGHR